MTMKRETNKAKSVILWIAGMLLSMICLMPSIKAQAATAPYITLKSVSSLTTTNAQINATIKNPDKVRLTKCGFILYSSSGTVLANRYDSINYTLSSFNGWFDLNDYYGTLAPETTYKYKFYIMTSGGTYYYSSLDSFKTGALAKPAVTLKSVSGLTYDNVQLNCSISNTGKRKLTKCGYILYNSSGTVLSNRYDSISYTMTSFNGWFDMNTYYGSLTPSTTYKYKCYVMDSNGNYFYSSLASFTTSARPSGTAKKLSYSSSKIAAVGPQPSGSVYCSVYAISYARAVAGKTPYDDPMAYWSSDGAVWSSGGMTSTKVWSHQAAFKKLYDQINAGKPAILYVYGPQTSGHYVTVIGYQNVTDTSALSMDNFIVIDPGYAAEKSLGIYTAPKMTHDSSGNEKGYQVVVF